MESARKLAVGRRGQPEGGHHHERGADRIEDRHRRWRAPGIFSRACSSASRMSKRGRRGRPRRAQGKLVIFHCKSGARTKINAPRLAGKFGETCEAFIVE